MNQHLCFFILQKISSTDSVSQKIPPRKPDIFHFFTNGCEFLFDFSHTYYRFPYLR